MWPFVFLFIQLLCPTSGIICRHQVMLDFGHKEVEQAMGREYARLCQNYTGDWCYTELGRPPSGDENDPHVRSTCAFNVSIETFCIERMCARVDQDIWRCCCNTTKCNDMDLYIDVLAPMYHKQKDKKWISVPTTVEYDMTTSTGYATTTTAETTKASGELKCITSSPESSGLVDNCDNCLISVSGSGQLTQSCDSSHECSGVVNGCKHGPDGLWCCCNTDHCNSLCLLSTGLTSVECVDGTNPHETEHPWLLYGCISVLLFLIIMLIVLQLVKGSIIRRRESNRKRRILIVEAAEHWVSTEKAKGQQ